MTAIRAFTAEQSEEQIAQHEKVVDYDTREYPIEVLVEKYRSGLESGQGEIYVPDYQREFVWNDERQSKLIESLLIGLPIPPIFVADVEDSDGRLEIVDGSQRIRTLSRFCSDHLQLVGLQKLDRMNGKSYSELTPARRRRFNRTTIRMIELTRKADENVRRDIFERINNGSDTLRDMERRRGSSGGPLLLLAEKLAVDPRFRLLAPISDEGVKRREPEELVLRFFAYRDGYTAMPRTIGELVDNYLQETTKNWTNKKSDELSIQWSEMLDFVTKHFPSGFREQPNHKSTRRNRYDSIAVGSSLALAAKPRLSPKSTDWSSSDEFKKIVTSGGSNTQANVTRRIEYVRDKLLDSRQQ